LLESIKKIFSNASEEVNDQNTDEELELLTGLMIEASNTDGSIDSNEIDKIFTILTDIFKNDSDKVNLSIKKCVEEINEPKSLHFFTSKINKIFSEEKKIILIETLWLIILSDGKVHEFESNLIRRLAGLLYVSDISCGNAKKRALNQMNEKN